MGNQDMSFGSAAIVGLGRMGLRHGQVLHNLGMRIAAIADANPEAVARAAGEFGVAMEACHADGFALLSRMVPDLLIVATTAQAHAELVIAAAERGVKLILCEKPMAVSLSQCDRMIEACERHGARLAINHQMRFMDQYVRPKALLESSSFGGVTAVTVVAGNFGLAMNGSHYLEMFRFITGEAPARVSAWFSSGGVPNPRGPQFEDRAGSMRVETASGKRFYLDCSADQGHGVRVVYAARHGQIAIDELAGRMVLSVRKAEHLDMPTTRYGMPWLDTDQEIAPADVIAPTQAVLAALLAGRDYPSGEDARMALEALAAAYWSAENGNASIAIGDPRLARDRIFPWA